MSDHAEKKKDDKPAEGEHAEKKKGGIAAMLTKLPVLLGGAMVIEAAVMLVAFKMLAGGPSAAKADVDLHADAKAETHGEPAADGHGEAAEKPAGHGEEKKAEDPHAKPEADAHGEAKEDAHGGGGGGHGDAAPAAAPATDPKKLVELLVVEFRAPNKMGGRTFLYDLSIYAVTKGKNKPLLEAAIKERGALIKDRIRTIIAQSDPDKLGGGAEPGLETLRRQVRYQLEQIVGDGIVDEVLVPRCIPFRTDF